MVQRNFLKSVFEVFTSAPKEFVEREFGWSAQGNRINRAKLKLFKRLVSRLGKVRNLEQWE